MQLGVDYSGQDLTGGSGSRRVRAISASDWNMCNGLDMDEIIEAYKETSKLGFSTSAPQVVTSEDAQELAALLIQQFARERITLTFKGFHAPQAAVSDGNEPVYGAGDFPGHFVPLAKVASNRNSISFDQQSQFYGLIEMECAETNKKKVIGALKKVASRVHPGYEKAFVGGF